jgi:mRNA interferase RelE/StbE
VVAYRLFIKPSAAKELDEVEPKKLRQRLVRAIEALEAEPRPAGCEKLAGGSDLYRIRQGHYRVVYSVDDRGRIVLVVRVGHRREVYR